MSKGQIMESFGLFEKHYKTYKSKVNYSESRLSFEVLSFIYVFLNIFHFQEYRWRSEFHRNFALILLRDFFNIKKNLIEKNLMLRFLNLFHVNIYIYIMYVYIYIIYYVIHIYNLSLCNL